MKTKSLKTQYYKQWGLLLAVLLVLSGCGQQDLSEAAGSANKLEALLQPAPPAGGSRFEIKTTEKTIELLVDGKTSQTLRNKGQAVSLVKGGKPGTVALTEPKFDGTLFNYLGSEIRQVMGGKIGTVSISGVVMENGEAKLKMTGLDELMGIKVGADECKYLDMGTDDGIVLVGTQVEPINMTFTTSEVSFKREGADATDAKKYSLESLKTPFYLLDCPELGEIPTGRLVDGGWGTVIVLDGIHDPDRKYVGGGMNQTQQEAVSNSMKKKMESRAGVECSSIKGKNWTKEPVACVPIETTGIKIYCNRYIVIPTVNGNITIDIIECGVKVEVTASKVKFYSGCIDAETVICK